MSKPRSGASQAGSSVPDIEASKLWIHCGRCYALYVEKKVKIFFLACNHVLCEKCVKVKAGRTPSDSCIFVCCTCKGNVRGREVSNTMPNHIKRFFHPEAFTLASEGIEKFQLSNHRHFDKFKERKEMEMNKLGKDISLAKSICQKRYQDLQTMRVERKKLSQRTRLIKAEVAKQKAEMHRFVLSFKFLSYLLMYFICIPLRMTQAKLNRTLESQKSSSSAQESIHGRTRGRVGSVLADSRRSSKDSGRGTQAKRRQVTSFMHQANHSFNL
ncbi:hypothetical protein KR084_006157 [Drosophila pseudotakahashii]|nr:hypothetical protein KR084_006157 [Drosophila pseudotakahashii]